MIAASLRLSAQPAASSMVPRDLLPVVHLATLPSQQLFLASIALGRGHPESCFSFPRHVKLISQSLEPLLSLLESMFQLGENHNTKGLH